MGRQRRRERRGPGPPVVGADLECAAVAVTVAGGGLVLLRVCRLRDPADAVVLVMSVMAAMWSQSMPWRMPRKRPVSRTPRPTPVGAVVRRGDDGSITSGPRWECCERTGWSPITQQVASACVMRSSMYTSHDVANGSYAPSRRRTGRTSASSCAPAACAGPRSAGRSSRSCRGPTDTSPAPSSSSAAGGGSGHDPVDGLPDARRPRGPGAAQPQPRRRRARGVPRPARSRPTAISTAIVRDDLGDHGR